MNLFSNFGGLAEVGGGGGPAAEFRSQMIPIMLEANTIRLRKGRGGGGPAAEFRSQMTKQEKVRGPPIILGMVGFRIICNPRIAKISNSHFAADGAGGGPAAEFRSQMTTGQFFIRNIPNRTAGGGEKGSTPFHQTTEL